MEPTRDSSSFLPQLFSILLHRRLHLLPAAPLRTGRAPPAPPPPPPSPRRAAAAAFKPPPAHPGRARLGTAPTRGRGAWAAPAPAPVPARPLRAPCEPPARPLCAPCAPCAHPMRAPCAPHACSLRAPCDSHARPLLALVLGGRLCHSHVPRVPPPGVLRGLPATPGPPSGYPGARTPAAPSPPVPLALPAGCWGNWGWGEEGRILPCLGRAGGNAKGGGPCPRC